MPTGYSSSRNRPLFFSWALCLLPQVMDLASHLARLVLLCTNRVLQLLVAIDSWIANRPPAKGKKTNNHKCNNIHYLSDTIIKHNKCNVVLYKTYGNHVRYHNMPIHIQQLHQSRLMTILGRPEVFFCIAGS